MASVINILGVTGSIGRSAAGVILAQPDRFDIQVLTAHTDAQGLAEMAVRLGAGHVVLSNPGNQENRDALLSYLKGHDITARFGPEALQDAAAMPADITLAAIMGMAGLPPLLKAIESSTAVAIANKEPLVSAGALVLDKAAQAGTKILPVDSEHNAIFQVFDFDRREDVRRLVLTASGGPFRDWSLARMQGATPAQALAHPNWSMGDKISIDSATMMNKALEVIEAHYLFGIAPESIEILVHPESIVHSMVEYKDGSVLAQLGAPDMRTPLANVLAWPDRLETPGQRLDFESLSNLSFERPDTDRFPALALAYQVLQAGPWACAALNAANEVAVQEFLAGRIGFPDIAACAMHVLETAEPRTLLSLEEILDFDQYVRTLTAHYINNQNMKKAV